MNMHSSSASDLWHDVWYVCTDDR